MTWYECIIDAHTAVTDRVSHGGFLHTDTYTDTLVQWCDIFIINYDLIADGKHIERAMIGTTDLFTSMEFDPWCEALEKAFDASEHIAWERLQPMYEADTKIWHYRWRWEVFGCG